MILSKLFQDLFPSLDIADGVGSVLHWKSGESRTIIAVDEHGRVTVDGVAAVGDGPLWIDLDPTGRTLRHAQPAHYPYYRSGAYLAYRIFLSDAGDDANYAPLGCGVACSAVTIRAMLKNETWANQ